VTRARLIACGLVVGAVALVALAACTPSRPHSHRPSVTYTSTTAPLPAQASAAMPVETCQALTDMDVLQSAEGFVLVGGAVEPGDVINTVISLRSVQRNAETEFQTALGNIINALEALDAAATDGTGETVDMSTVGPDSNLLAGMCRARGLPAPAVLPQT
jgi:hypothetical protein